MSQAAVVYWSGTGHTEAMAQAVAAAAQADLFTAAEFDADKAAHYAAIAFGCPSMGAEQLEESEFEPMFEAVKPALAGKKIALFGSYGWGGGEWMRTWEDDCAAAGLTLCAESVICQDEAGRRGACRLRRAGRSAEISARFLYAYTQNKLLLRAYPRCSSLSFFTDIAICFQTRAHPPPSPRRRSRAN